MSKIVVIAHNLRSAHNVGSLLRTADGLGVHKVYLTGHTPYPHHEDDERMPHISRKIDKQISKTALGAEKSAFWEYQENIYPVIDSLKNDGYAIAGLEQTKDSTSLPNYKSPGKLVIILGREVEGIEPEVLERCDITLEIPMIGAKESYNVVQAAAMALYHCTFYPFTAEE